MTGVNEVLRRLGQQWMAVANAIGNFNSRVVLTLVYAVVVSPFGLVVRMCGDPLGLRGSRQSTWTDPYLPSPSLENARKQF